MKEILSIFCFGREHSKFLRSGLRVRHETKTATPFGPIWVRYTSNQSYSHLTVLLSIYNLSPLSPVNTGTTPTWSQIAESDQTMNRCCRPTRAGALSRAGSV